MSTKTDLAKEIIERISPEYSGFSKRFYKNIKITEAEIKTPEDEALFEKPKGKYITLEVPLPGDFEEGAAAAAKEISALIPKEGDILFVGLGNLALTADSLGPMAAGMLPCGKFRGRSLCAFSPDVEGRTGINSERLVSALIRELSPAAVIVADSLAAEKLSHICKTIQITDSGIAPGSGKAKQPFPRKNSGFLS